MVAQIINMFTLVFSNLSTWLTQILDSTGMMPIVLSAIFLMFLLRYFIRPVVGGASDKVNKKLKKARNSSDQEE